MYSPLASETTVRVSAVPSLRIVTFAPATTAPDASVTVPRIVPVTDCPAAGRTAPSSSSAQLTTRSAERPACFMDVSSEVMNRWLTSA